MAVTIGSRDNPNNQHVGRWQRLAPLVEREDVKMSNGWKLELTRWGAQGYIRLVFWDFLHGEDVIYHLTDDAAQLVTQDEQGNEVLTPVVLSKALRELRVHLEGRE